MTGLPSSENDTAAIVASPPGSRSQPSIGCPLARSGSKEVPPALRDAPFPGLPQWTTKAKAEVDRLISYHRRALFPLWI